MSEEKRPLSNDDIIMDLISEIKVEKTLLQSNIDEIVDDGAGCIDPQLLSVNNEELVEDGDLTEGGNDLEVVHFAKVSENGDISKDGDDSTLDGTELDTALHFDGSNVDLKKPQILLPTTTLPLNNGLGNPTNDDGENDDDQSVSPSVSELFEWSLQEEAPLRLDIVQYDESEPEFEPESNEQPADSQFQEVLASQIDQNNSQRYHIDGSIGDQVFPDSFKISFSTNMNSNSSIGESILHRDGSLLGQDSVLEEELNSVSRGALMDDWNEDMGSLNQLKSIPTRRTVAYSKSNSPLEEPNQDNIKPQTSTPKLKIDALDVISAVGSARSSPIFRDSGIINPQMMNSSFYKSFQEVQSELGVQQNRRVEIIVPLSDENPRIIFSGNTEDKPISRGNSDISDGSDVLNSSFLPLSPCPKPPPSSPTKAKNNEMLENPIQSSFNLKSDVAVVFDEDDRLAVHSQHPNFEEENIPISEVLSAKFLDTSTAFRGDSSVYTGTSLLNILANDLGRNFPTTPIPEEPKDYAGLKNKEDWIKSLNSAFEIDEDLTQELEGMGVIMPDIDQYSESPSLIEESTSKPKSYKKAFTLSPLSIKKRNPPTAKSPPLDHEPSSGNPLQSAESNRPLSTEKITGFLNKLSARITSASGNFSKVNTRVTSPKFNQNTSYTDKNGDEITSAGVINEAMSPPGTLTAKLFEENGIGTKRLPITGQKHFVETIVSAVGKTEKSSQPVSEEENNDEKNREESIDEPKHSTASNNWKPNNRFLDYASKSPLHRKKTIKKIFTSRSKESASTDHTKETRVPPSIAISDETSEGKLTWRNSIFRKKSVFKNRSVSKDLSMDSGVSLEGFAAEYAREKSLEVSQRLKEIMSTETADAKKIIEVNLAIKSNQPYYELPITRDSEFSLGTDDTLGSYLSEKLNPPKPLSEYVKTPIPTHERSGPSFLKTKNHRRLSFMNRSKSVGNMTEAEKIHSVRFAPSPDFKLETKKSKGKEDESPEHYEDSYNDFSRQPQKSILQNQSGTNQRGRSILHRLRSVYSKK